MNKNILLVLAIIAITITFAKGQPCLSGGETLTLTTQESIDNFATDYPNCTELNGTLIIEEETPGDIVNLNGLSPIEKVWQKLIIRNNSQLQNLSGLDNLFNLGVLEISNNENLSSLTGLESVVSIPIPGGNASPVGLLIEDNAALLNLNGLSNLEFVENYFIIRNNNALTDLSGLSSLEEVDGDFEIINCEGLQNLSGMTALSSHSVASLRIGGCPGLTNLNGLEALQHTSGVSVFECAGLTSLTGLHNLLTTDFLSLQECPLVTDFSSLTSIDTIRNGFGAIDNLGLLNLSGLEETMYELDNSVVIQGNASLNSIEQLSSITKIRGLGITDNPLLCNLDGLNSLETLVGITQIIGNQSLKNVDGLESLTDAGRLFTIAEHDSLENLLGLSSLQRGGEEWFGIWENPMLTDLSGLDNLDTLEGHLYILRNAGLTSLDGLENLKVIMNDPQFSIGFGNFYGLQLDNNPLLTDISAISDLSFGESEGLGITNNESLSYCGVGSICNYLLTGGAADIYNNAPGCNMIPEVIESCFEGIPHSNMVGELIADANANCADDDETRIADWFVTFENDSLSWITNANSDGEYWLPAYEGDWTLDVISPSIFWTSCFGDTLVSATGLEDTIITDFYMQPEGDCSYIEWDLTIDQLRICDSSTIVIDYCNYGALPSEDLLFIVALDTFLTFQNASIPYTVDGDGNYIFAVDTLDLFECGEFELTAFVDCDSLEIWDVQCVDVELFSEELCSPDSLWDGSIIKVDGYCENDSIYFDLENIGTGDMLDEEQFRVEIVIDDIILFFNVGDYQLVAGAIETLSFPAEDSQGMMISADQRPGFPGEAEATAIVANCDDIQNNEILFFLPGGDNGDPFTESFCEPTVNSFDPNDKSAIPQGLGYYHTIREDWRLNYTVRFQNTGNAVANKVVIIDQLSPYLDLSTIEIGTASHSFTWNLNQARELVFTFENILLSDSTSNEPESHGYVRFSILPEQGIIPNTTIENSAAIYFDSNEPIITNTVDHRILKPVVVSSAEETHCAGELYNDNPIWNDTTIQVETSFLEYDSIHFAHLKVVPSVTNEVALELPVGTVFEGVLIEEDMVFPISYTAQNGCDSVVTYTVTGIVSTDDPDASLMNIEIYPNPASDVINVLYNQNGRPQIWSLVNVIGQKVWQRELDANEEFKAMNVSELPRGVYLLRVDMEAGGEVWKVVLE